MTNEVLGLVGPFKSVAFFHAHLTRFQHQPKSKYKFRHIQLGFLSVFYRAQYKVTFFYQDIFVTTYMCKCLHVHFSATCAAICLF